LWAASAICLTLLAQRVRLAASRTFWAAGSSRPMSTAMMAMTTSSSISVNADRRDERLDMTPSPGKNDETEQEATDGAVAPPAGRTRAGGSPGAEFEFASGPITLWQGACKELPPPTSARLKP